MTGAEGHDDLPDDTIRVSRGDAVPDDHTLRSPRAVPSSPSGQSPAESEQSIEAEDRENPDGLIEPDDPEDATILSQARGGEDTEPVGNADGTPGSRRRAGTADAEEPDDGSTMVVRRESRRRAARADSADVAAPLPASSASDPRSPTGRVAQAPAEKPPIYKPRAPEPVIAERSAPPSRPPQTPIDTRAGLLFRRRRARQLALVAVIAGCFVVTVLLAALVAFTTSLGW